MTYPELGGCHAILEHPFLTNPGLRFDARVDVGSQRCPNSNISLLRDGDALNLSAEDEAGATATAVLHEAVSITGTSATPLLGAWQGQVTEPGLDPYSTTLNLRWNGAALEGDVTYRDLGDCRGNLDNPWLIDGSLVIRRTVDTPSDQCTDAWLTLRPGGATLVYSADAGPGETADGVLEHPQGPQTGWQQLDDSDTGKIEAGGGSVLNFACLITACGSTSVSRATPTAALGGCKWIAPRHLQDLRWW